MSTATPQRGPGEPPSPAPAKTNGAPQGPAAPAIGPGSATPVGTQRPPPERARPPGERPAPSPDDAPPRAGGLAKAIFVAGNALGALSARLYSKTRERGGAVYEGFQGRPQHVRFRAYALMAYGVILAATLAGQLYSSNKLGAYVRVQRVDIPATVEIFVRNDSRTPWSNVRLQLNGIYNHDRSRLAPGEYIQLKVEGFTLSSSTGAVAHAPRNVHISQLTIDTDQGHYELEPDK